MPHTISVGITHIFISTFAPQEPKVDKKNVLFARLPISEAVKSTIVDTLGYTEMTKVCNCFFKDALWMCFMTYIHTNVHTYIHMCVCVCCVTYIHVYVYIYIYYVCVYIYIWVIYSFELPSVRPSFLPSFLPWAFFPSLFFPSVDVFFPSFLPSARPCPFRQRCKVKTC